jgi:hypothetical protein
MLIGILISVFATILLLKENKKLWEIYEFRKIKIIRIRVFTYLFKRLRRVKIFFSDKLELDDIMASLTFYEKDILSIKICESSN